MTIMLLEISMQEQLIFNENENEGETLNSETVSKNNKFDQFPAHSYH